MGNVPEPSHIEHVCAAALDVAAHALLAEHPTLIDDFHRPGERGRVVDLAGSICTCAGALRETLVAYRRAVRDAVAPSQPQNDDADLPF